LGIDLTLKAVSNNPTKQSVLDFLKSADIGIVDITIEKQQAKQTTFKIDGATSKASLSNPVDAEVLIPFFNHVVTGKSVTFGLQDESQGTQRLFAFAGIILFVLERGMTLAVDEIESSMHPLLVRHILGLFFSPETNPHGAQIVFTTHSTNLLDNTLLRRDQIWFTEKSNDQATMLVPLSDFSPRKTEAFEKGYLEGRYGAIPTLSEFRMPADVPDARK
jgi:AAA15 family ATPase/GTPase